MGCFKDLKKNTPLEMSQTRQAQGQRILRPSLVHEQVVCSEEKVLDTSSRFVDHFNQATGMALKTGLSIGHNQRPKTTSQSHDSQGSVQRTSTSDFLVCKELATLQATRRDAGSPHG